MSAPYSPLPHSPSSTPPQQSLRDLELDDRPSFSASDRPRHHRSSTVTSLGGFEFQHALLPLTLSGEGGGDGQAGGSSTLEEEKHLTALHGFALIVGTQVGSGIFSSPGVVVAEVGSAGASLAVWVLSALLAWTGASSFAELGCAIPLSGGAQAYLAYAFGPMVSYLYTWTAVSTLKPGSAAIIALIFGEYVNRLIYHAVAPDPDGTVPEWTFKITAVLAVVVASVLNLVSRSMGTSSTMFLTAIKIGSLLFVAILGIIFLIRHGPGPSLVPSTLFDGTSSSPSRYAIALYSGLWAFDGWDACCFVSGEMRNTRRDLPLALHSSMATVLALFVFANVSYFVVLDPQTVASSNTVALDFGRATIGKVGGLVFSALVAVSCFGALSTGFYTCARLICASARDHFLPDFFARLHHRRRTPDNAMALQAGLTCFFIVFGGGFRTLLNFFSVTSWTFYLLTVFGLLVLRVKEPHLERPYKAWITTPIIFCAVAMFLLLMPIFAAPLEAFAALVFMSVGVPMYYVTYESRSRSANKLAARDTDGGWRAAVSSGWDKFMDDLTPALPRKWQRPPRVGRAVEQREESRGMLGRETLEMSER